MPPAFVKNPPQGGVEQRLGVPFPAVSLVDRCASPPGARKRWTSHVGRTVSDPGCERNGMSSKQSGLAFKVGDHVVYPAHGVGKVAAVETQEVAGMSLEVYVVTFDHEKMTLRVPTAKAKTAGLRPLAAEDVVGKALTTLKGRARIKRTMWSRRAQEYEAKINSRSEEHTSELQSRENLVCRLL